MVLFQPARTVEAVKSYGHPRPDSVRGLGNFDFSNIVKDIFSGTQTAVETITGAKAAREARESTLALAKINAERDAAQAAASTATIKAVAPWVGLAVVLVGGLVAFKVMGKKK